MKSIKQLFILALICSPATLFAQQKVALQSNGVTTIFGGANPFTDAYNAAASGDTLYLPGGNLPFPATIDKGLVIIGAGHYPDSTAATDKTLLTGNLTISQNADKLHLEGFELSGTLNFSNNQKVDSVVIKRCKIGAITYTGNRTSACEFNEILECVITGGIVLSNAKNSIINNSIVEGQVFNGLNMGISNNLFLYNESAALYYYVTLDNVDASMISNNIFFRMHPNLIHRDSETNTFTKNIFVGIPTEGLNTFTDNYNSVSFTNLFVNQSGTIFDYAQDYHMVNPALYLGTNGTQVGIYGGFYPYKAGAVPINPHFQLKNIATQTDSNGDLNIQIKVQSQDN